MSIQDAIRYDRKHIIMSNSAHVALGFGIAVLLQEYISGNAFISVWIAYILIVLGLIEHIRAWSSRKPS